jgi:tetratricopeptide (TPR) repeat protein
LARRAYAALVPDGDARLFAVAVAALRLLHAALPETLNYHLARSDVFSTFAAAAGLWVFAAFPRLRSLHLGALIAAAGILAKEPVAVYPGLVGAWVLIVERRGIGAAVLATLPAAVVCGGVFWWTRGMQGPAMTWGGVDRATYLLTQAWVVPQYLWFFLWPAGATVDHDQEFLTQWSDLRVLGGAAILLAALFAAACALRRPRGRLFAFGLAWAALALAPSSSVVPLYEARNDHRVFFPFLGLTIALVAAFAAGADAVLRQARAAGKERFARGALAAAFVLFLGAHAAAVVARNRTWSSAVALWEEAAVRAPRNGRAAMNAGSARMRRADYDAALAHFLRARTLTPRYALLEINLGILKDELGDFAAADEHFRLAAEYQPRDARVPYWNGRRRMRRGDAFSAAADFGLAVRLAPGDPAARRDLLAALEAAELPAQLVAAAAEARAAFPKDPVIAAAIDRLPPQVRAAAEKAARVPPSAEAYAELSAALFGAKRYAAAVSAARTATELDPTRLDAWNNLGAAYGGLGRYSEEIAACREALKIDPQNRLARANLARAEAQAAAASRAAAPAGRPSR